MRKLKYEVGYIKKLVKLFTEKGITLSCDTDCMTIHEDNSADALNILQHIDIHPLTYQVNEMTKEVEIFDSRP